MATRSPITDHHSRAVHLDHSPDNRPQTRRERSQCSGINAFGTPAEKGQRVQGHHIAAL
jgi:hypothetical protein